MVDADPNALVAQILSSYLANNTVAAADLAGVIASVKRAFSGSSDASVTSEAIAPPKIMEPIVSIKKSVTPDALICLCCGEKFKSLKRHLRAAHGMDPSQYRAAFNLKRDYPIVAPAYAATRSALAKSLGLGRTAKTQKQPKKGGRKIAPKAISTNA